MRWISKKTKSRSKCVRIRNVQRCLPNKVFRVYSNNFIDGPLLKLWLCLIFDSFYFWRRIFFPKIFEDLSTFTDFCWVSFPFLHFSDPFYVIVVLIFLDPFIFTDLIFFFCSVDPAVWKKPKLLIYRKEW